MRVVMERECDFRRKFAVQPRPQQTAAGAFARLDMRAVLGKHSNMAGYGPVRTRI